jgi:hypothetical protein
VLVALGVEPQESIQGLRPVDRHFFMRSRPVVEFLLIRPYRLHEPARDPRESVGPSARGIAQEKLASRLGHERNDVRDHQRGHLAHGFDEKWLVAKASDESLDRSPLPRARERAFERSNEGDPDVALRRQRPAPQYLRVGRTIDEPARRQRQGNAFERRRSAGLGLA